VPAQLVTEQGPTSASVFLLPDEGVTAIGRSHDNQLVLLDRHVSRYHGWITGRNGRYFLYDNRTTNGTKLDGRKLECETPLRDGQLIRVGSIWLRFRQLPDEGGQVPSPIAFDPAWLSANDRAVTRLAETILEEKNFDLLPVLADALEDAGCHDAEVLEHCRQPGRHHSSCWVLDLIVPPSKPAGPEAPDESTVMKLLPWSPELGD
jgi:hypothetical protein